MVIVHYFSISSISGFKECFLAGSISLQNTWQSSKFKKQDIQPMMNTKNNFVCVSVGTSMRKSINSVQKGI